MRAYQSEQVLLTNDYCVNATKKEISYLLRLDPDRLLAGFRENAGINGNGAARYPGWESTLIGGHTLGHYLTAIAQGYKSPNVSAQEKKALLERIEYLIDGLWECQNKSKGQTGFLFGANVIDEENVEIQFDNVEQGLSDITTQAWVPWYTMHKLIAGIISVYQFTKNETAREIAAKLGDWVYERVSGWSKETKDNVLRIEYGGMNDCLYSLYTITQEENHAVAAHFFDEVPLYENVAAGGNNVLNKLHANTTIPKFIGALNRYQTLHNKTLGEEVVDASRYLFYAECFFDMVVEYHTYVTGGNSEWEHFGEDGILDAKRTNCNCETCNTYNMLKLAAMLYEITGQPKYMDYYEKAYINTILSSQNPGTGMTTYFQPMGTGYFKVYGEEFTKFWCCIGSGMENFTKLNSNLYYYDEHTVYTAMYISSELTSPMHQIRLIQNSNLETDGTVKFTIDCNGKHTARLRLAFRIPEWADGTVQIVRNGTKATATMENGYVILEDSFQDKETIILKFILKVYACGLPDAEDVFAFCFGPFVLSAKLGTKDMEQTVTGVDVTIPARKIPEKEILTINSATVSVQDYINAISSHMIRSGNTMNFTLQGVTPQLTFISHFLQYKERYGIYWYIKQEQ